VIERTDHHQQQRARSCRRASQRARRSARGANPRAGGRNTAPGGRGRAIASAARRPRRSLLVLPSDHAIATLCFRDAVLTAAELPTKLFWDSASGHAAAHRVRLHRARRTAFGRDAGFASAASSRKAGSAECRQYLESGRFLWNSGMFVFSARRYLEELASFRRDILEGAEESAKAAGRDLTSAARCATFNACPAESVRLRGDGEDLARRSHPSDIGWSDVGSWSALWTSARKTQRKM